MAGYIRNDTNNNIATGNVVRAADLDGEFDSIVAAFNASSGHTHDGTSGEGGPITKVGPAQNINVTALAVLPAIHNTMDLGSNGLRFKDGYFEGSVNSTGGYVGNLTGDVTGNVTGDLTGNADTVTALQTARNIAGVSFDGTADIEIPPENLLGVTSEAAELNILDGATVNVNQVNTLAGSDITTTIQAQLNLKAPIDSPTFTGTPELTTTPTAGDNSTKLASTAYVDNAVSSIIDSAPTNLDTLNELAAALGDDSNFATTVTNSLALKAPINSPTFTGTAQLNATPATGDNSTKIATTEFVQNALVGKFEIPTGMILLWSGSSASIPTGWVLCDGANGTPDLRSKFIMGSGSDTYPDGAARPTVAGGSANVVGNTSSGGNHNHGASTGNHSLTEAQMPKHFHLMVGPNAVTRPQTNGGTVGIYGGGTPNDPAWAYGTYSTGGGAGSGSANTGTGNGTGHNHSIGNSGSHTHSINIAFKPSYIALCYIMKT